MKAASIISGLILLLLSTCTTENKNSSNSGEQNKNKSERQLTEFEFKEEFHNFGKLSEGETVVFSFVFRNKGNEDLVIENASSDCGCIRTKFDAEPVKPGVEGTVEVELNTEGLFNEQLKTVIVTANIPEKQKILYVTAEVVNEAIKINKENLIKNN